MTNNSAWVNFVSNGMLAAVGLLLQSTLVLALGLVAAYMARRSPLLQSLLQRATLCMLLGAILLSVGAARYIPAVPGLTLWKSRLPTRVELSQEAAQLSQRNFRVSKPSAAVVVTRQNPSTTTRVAPPLHTASSPGTAQDVAPETISSPAGSTAPARYDATSDVTRLGTAVVVWLLGTVIALGWLLFCQFRLWALRRRCQVVCAGRTWELLQLSSTQFGLRAPLLLKSDAVRSPFLCGVRTPAIVLPIEAYGWDEETCRVVLLHELAHLRRADVVWMMMAHIVNALLWLQPLMWLLRRHMEGTAERACDALVLHHGCAPLTYARCLLDISEHCVPASQRALTAGVTPQRSALGRRVQEILENRRHGMAISKRARASVVLAAVTLAAAASLLFADRPASQNPSEEAAAQQQANAALLQAAATSAVDRSSPIATVRSFMAALNRRDARAIAACIAGPEAELLEAAGYFVEGKPRGLETRFLVSDLREQPEGEIATVTLQVDERRVSGTTEAGYGPRTTSLSLRRDGNVWKLVIPSSRDFMGMEGSSLKWVLYPLSPPHLANIKALKNWAKGRGNATVTGRVLHEDGSPISGKTVYVSISQQEINRLLGFDYQGIFFRGLPRQLRNLVTQSATTGEDGTYRVNGLTSAIYDVQVPHYRRTKKSSTWNEPLPQEVAAGSPRVVANEGQSVTAPDLRMTRGAVLEARVLDAVTGKPLPGILVVAHRRPPQADFTSVIEVDAQGRSLFRLPPGEVWLSLSGRFARGKGYSIEINNTYYSLASRVSAELDGKTGRVPSGTSTRVLMQAGRQRSVVFRLNKYVAPSPPRALRTFGRRMPPATAVLTGRVVYEDGRPAQGVSITALIQRTAQWAFMRGHDLAMKAPDKASAIRWKQIKGALHKHAVTGTDGRFRLMGLTTAPYNLSISAQSNNAGTASPPRHVATTIEGVWAKSGQVVQCAKPLVLRSGALIEGRLIDKATSLPLGGVRIAYTGPQMPSSADSAILINSDNDGRFHARVSTGTTRFYIAGPTLNESDDSEYSLTDQFRYADDGTYINKSRATATACILTNRGIFAGSNVQYVLDTQKPQLGLGFGKTINVDVTEGQTRKLTLRLRRLVKVTNENGQ